MSSQALISLLIALLGTGGIWGGVEIVRRWWRTQSPAQKTIDAMKAVGNVVELQDDALEGLGKQLARCQAEVERQGVLINSLVLDNQDCHSRLALSEMKGVTAKFRVDALESRVAEMVEQLTETRKKLQDSEDAAQRGGRRKEDML